MGKMYRLLILSLLILILGVACSNAEKDTVSRQEGGGSDSPKKFKIASVLDSDHAYIRENIPMWIETAEKELENIEFEYIGGSESVPEENLLSSVQNGIIDIAFLWVSHHRDEVPSADSTSYTTLTPQEEREIGYFDYLADELEKAGVVYLGRFLSGFGYYLWTNDKIESIEDFKGLKIRSNPYYLNIIKNLDATPVNVAAGDVYTSLERNLVDGFAFPLLGPREDGWTEVTKYLIDSEFGEQVSIIVMNADAYEELTEEEKEKLDAATQEYESLMVEYFEGKNAKEMEAIKESDVDIITLSDEDEALFQEHVKNANRKLLEENLPEEDVEKIEGMFYGNN